MIDVFGRHKIVNFGKIAHLGFVSRHLIEFTLCTIEDSDNRRVLGTVRGLVRSIK
jgi:hypothetical protein